MELRYNKLHVQTHVQKLGTYAPNSVGLLTMTDQATALSATPASELDDDALRRELANTHQLDSIVEQRGIREERVALHTRLAELDNEYLRRFPNAAQRWPWPLPEVAPATT